MSKMKKVGLALITALLAIIVTATPVLAYIGLPSATPTIESINIFRNVLGTGDWLAIIYENTPYTTTPSTPYDDAFIWRLIDTDNVTELAQSLGYNYHALGYGYNIISFYLNAGNVTAKGIEWLDALKLRLSGTPLAFASPPTYTYDISVADYNASTVSLDVQDDISSLILTLAADLDSKWGLTGAATSLLVNDETGTTLSVYGQAFFRGAIYGVQSMAPSAFPVQISSIELIDRTWTGTYTTNLSTQYGGLSYIDTGIAAGKSMLDVSYNLFGLILTLLICLGLIFSNWYLAGGNLWRGFIESSAPLVICARISLLGLGELGLIAAICWIYISAKIWRMI